MAKIKLINTYHYFSLLEDKELANARTLEEIIQVLLQFREVKDAIYRRDLESFDTTH